MLLHLAFLMLEIQTGVFILCSMHFAKHTISLAHAFLNYREGQHFCLLVSTLKDNPYLRKVNRKKKEADCHPLSTAREVDARIKEAGAESS